MPNTLSTMMQPGDRIQKSAAGRTALASRSADFPAPLRALLLMVYGEKTAAEYSQLASQLPVGRDGLMQLAEMGFIEVVVAEASASTPPPPLISARSTAPSSTPMADVTTLQATYALNETGLQQLLYPEFVRAVSNLGLRGVLLMLKIERAVSAQELLALRELVESAIAKAKGEPARLEFAQRVDFLLSQ